jgi:two-component system sensor histidine kinase RpfC
VADTAGRLSALWRRLSGRSDSEHAQAGVRILLVALILVYVLVSRSHWQFGAGYRPLLAMVLTAQAVSLLIFGWLLWRPQRSDVRRIAGMLQDYGLMSAAMALMGEPMAFVYVVVMWVTVGNGMRYGARYLQAAVAMALVCFSVPLIVSPYWQANLGLGVGLWLGLAAVPLYFSSLLGQLTRATEDARRASEAKTRFLANMSHEFRTPLNGLSGMTEVLATTELDAEQRECLATIQASSRSLLSLVEEVLDISAIEAGKLRTWREPFAPRELFGAIGLILRPQARSKGLDYRVQLDEQVPMQLVGDVIHVRQILLNLAGNAVKFTDHGQVELRVTTLPSPSTAEYWLRIEVVDTGIGVPLALRARLFDAFEQGDTSLARRHEGSGLGTTIAKGLVEALDGRIGHADNPGGGSCFWVELPFGVMPLASAATPAVADDAASDITADNVIAFSDPFVRHRARVRSMHLLVADDHQANRMVLQRLLQKAGHRVTCVDGGEAVLDAIAETDFDAAVLDLHMPGMSGLDLIKQARVLQAGPGARTPVIVLSADVTPEAIDRCLRAGAHCFLAKPLVASRLLDELAAIARESQLPRASVPDTRRAPAVGNGAVLDAQVLDELAALGLGQAFELAFIKQCLADASECLLALHRAGEAGQWTAMRDHAHALKGVAGNVGLHELATLAGQLMGCRDSELAQAWGQWQPRLQQSLAQGRQALTQRQDVAASAVDGPGQAPA